MNLKYSDNMPNLNLSIPTETGVSENVELNEDLLRQWIKHLPKQNKEQYLTEYLTALKRFNGNKLGFEQRLLLLDIYREPLNKFVLTYTQSDMYNSCSGMDHYRQVISTLSETLSQLAIGYKIIVVESLDNNANLKLNNFALMAVNRVGEQLTYMALHAYKFYQAIPAKVLNELHQLYMLVLTCGVEDKIPKLSTMPVASASYKSRYSQLLLVCICNPYGLPSNQVVRAYQLMEQFAAVTELSVLSQGSSAMAGHFYINCLSDEIPIASVLPMIEDQKQPPALVLDTKPALVMVDLLFQRTAQVENHPDGTDIELLKSLIPYLNTSYERQEPRRTINDEKYIHVAVGIDAVHESINAANASSVSMNGAFDDEPWRLLNKTSSGYLISQERCVYLHHVFVGDLIGIFEPREGSRVSSSKIGFIRWIRTDVHNMTKIGISLIEGDPISVKYGLIDDEELKPALFLPEVARIHQPASLITPKSVVPINALLRIKPNKKRFEFTLLVNSLLSSGSNFDHLSLSDGD